MVHGDVVEVGPHVPDGTRGVERVARTAVIDEQLAPALLGRGDWLLRSAAEGGSARGGALLDGRRVAAAAAAEGEQDGGRDREAGDGRAISVTQDDRWLPAMG